MLKVAIVVGSTRPGRKAEAVAKWVHQIATTRDDGEYEIVDIEHYKLPLLDEPFRRRWASTTIRIRKRGPQRSTALMRSFSLPLNTITARRAR